MMKPLLFVIVLTLIIFSAACSPAETTLSDDEYAIEETAIENSDNIILTTEAATSYPTELPPTATLPPTNTSEPTLTATPRTILWQDDFSDVNSGWERYRQFDGVLDYLETDEVYQMQLTQQGNFFWVYKYTAFTDLVLSIDATQMAGPDGASFGVICRFDRPNVTGVVFLISSNGQAGVGTIEDLVFQPLPGGELTDFSSINTGLEAINTLEAACVGDQLRFSVNGDQLFELSAPDIYGDAIGLVADSALGEGVDVYFDNLVIFEP